MALREIVTLPEPVLKRKAHPVTKFDKNLQTLIDDMIETMRDAPGVGLAAPQIVTDATAKYLQAEDAIAAWIDDCATRDPNAFAKNSELFASWSGWATKCGEYVGSQKRFSQNLEARGFSPHRHRQLGRGFQGIRLVGGVHG